MTGAEMVGLLVGVVLILLALAGLWLAWYCPAPGVEHDPDDQEGGDVAC